MTIWIDAQLSPALARWINRTFQDLEAKAINTIGLRDSTDDEIFHRARQQNVVVMSKDRDFLNLIELYGPPPQIIWITCGNTSNDRLKQILLTSLHTTIDLLKEGEPLVEISDL